MIDSMATSSLSSVHAKGILVTGGAGFIGSQLVERLIALGNCVVVVDNLSTGKKSYVPKEAKLVKLDTGRDHKGLHKLVRALRPSVVYHLAAQKDLRWSVAHPLEDAKTNILGTLHLLDAVRDAGGGRVIFTSTAAVYPPGAHLPTREEDVEIPDTPYGISKRTAEMYLAHFASLYPMACVSLRFSNVYGPRQNLQSAGVMKQMIDALLHDRTFVINGSGEQTRDFIFVDDVVDALVRAMHVSWCGELNISTQTEVSVNTLWKMAQELVGVERAADFADAKEGDVFQSCLDASQAGHVLGWSAKTHLRAGLEKTIAWERAQEATS